MKSKTLWIIVAVAIIICVMLLFMKLNPATVKRLRNQIPAVKEFFLSHKDLFLKVEAIRASNNARVAFRFTRNPKDRDEIMVAFNDVSDKNLKSQIEENKPYNLNSSIFLLDDEKETINQLFGANLNDISIMSISEILDYRIELVSRTDFRIDRMDDEELALARANPYYVTVDNIVDDWYIVIFEPQKRLD